MNKKEKRESGARIVAENHIEIDVSDPDDEENFENLFDDDEADSSSLNSFDRYKIRSQKIAIIVDEAHRHHGRQATRSLHGLLFSFPSPFLFSFLPLLILVSCVIRNSYGSRTTEFEYHLL